MASIATIINAIAGMITLSAPKNNRLMTVAPSPINPGMMLDLFFSCSMNSTTNNAVSTNDQILVYNKGNDIAFLDGSGVNLFYVNKIAYHIFRLHTGRYNVIALEPDQTGTH